ncbi:hypothetical protein MRX96_011654 [Rhipicephalus microplus]
MGQAIVSGVRAYRGRVRTEYMCVHLCRQGPPASAQFLTRRARLEGRASEPSSRRIARYRRIRVCASVVLVYANVEASWPKHSFASTQAHVMAHLAVKGRGVIHEKRIRLAPNPATAGTRFLFSGMRNRQMLLLLSFGYRRCSRLSRAVMEMECA